MQNYKKCMNKQKLIVKFTSSDQVYKSIINIRIVCNAFNIAKITYFTFCRTSEFPETFL